MEQQDSGRFLSLDAAESTGWVERWGRLKFAVQIGDGAFATMTMTMTKQTRTRPRPRPRPSWKRDAVGSRGAEPGEWH